MMRVRHLQTYLSEGGLLQESDLKTLRCMRVGIETAYWLRLLSPLRDPLGEPLGGVSAASLICALTEQLDFFRLHDISPTFVFDGVVPLPQHALFSSHRQQHIEEAWLLYAREQLALLRCQQRQQRKEKTFAQLSQGDAPRNTSRAVYSGDAQTAGTSSGSSTGYHPVSTGGLSSSEQERAAERRSGEDQGDREEKEARTNPSSSSSDTPAEERDTHTRRRRLPRAEQDEEEEQSQRERRREKMKTDQTDTRKPKRTATEEEETPTTKSHHGDRGEKIKQNEDETSKEEQLQRGKQQPETETTFVFGRGSSNIHTSQRSHVDANSSVVSGDASSSWCSSSFSTCRSAQRKGEDSRGSREDARSKTRGSSGTNTSLRRTSKAPESCSDGAEIACGSCTSDSSNGKNQQSPTRSHSDSNSSSRSRRRSSGSSSSKQTQGTTGKSSLWCDRSCSSTPSSGAAHSSVSSSSFAGLSTSSSSRNCSSSTSRSSGISNGVLVHGSLSHDSSNSSSLLTAPVPRSSNCTSCSPLLQHGSVSLSSSSSPSSSLPPSSSPASCLRTSSGSASKSSSSSSASSCCCCCSSHARAFLFSSSDVTCKFLQGSSLVTREMLLFTFHFLKSRGIACVCAPSLAAAQLVYWGRHGLFEAVLGPPALILFGATRVLLHIDWLRGSFRWLEQQQLLQLCGVSSIQFLDACLLAGTEYCKTFPFLNLPALHLPYNMRFSFRSAIECARQAPLLTYILQCPAEAMRKEQYEGYCFCKTLVQYPLVLQLAAGVQPLLPYRQVQQQQQGQQVVLRQQHRQQQQRDDPSEKQQQQRTLLEPQSLVQHAASSFPDCSSIVNEGPLPRDFCRVSGRRLPFHFYFLMMEGILSQDLLSALAFEQWSDSRPPCADTVEYRDILTAIRGHRCTALNMLAAYLHPDFQLRPIHFLPYQPCRAVAAEQAFLLQREQQREQPRCSSSSSSGRGDSKRRPDSSSREHGDNSDSRQRDDNSRSQSSGGDTKSISNKHRSSSSSSYTSSSHSSSSHNSSQSEVQAYLLKPEDAPNTRRRWCVDALRVQQEMHRQRTHRVDLLFCLRWHAHAFHHKDMHRLCENSPTITVAPAPQRTAAPAQSSSAGGGAQPVAAAVPCTAAASVRLAGGDTRGTVNNDGAAAPHGRRQQEERQLGKRQQEERQQENRHQEERQQEERQRRVQEQQQPQSCNSILAAAHFVLLDALGFFSDRLEPTVFGEVLMHAPPQFQEEILFFLELLKTGLVDGAAYEPPVDRVYAPEVSALLLLRSQILDRECLRQPERQKAPSKQQEQRQQQDDPRDTEQQQNQQRQDRGAQWETAQEKERPQQQQEGQQQDEEDTTGSRQHRVLLLSRLCSLLPMQLQPHTCWNGGGISFEVSAFSCVAGVLKNALRHITEASVASVLLRDIQQLLLLSVLVLLFGTSACAAANGAAGYAAATGAAGIGAASLAAPVSSAAAIIGPDSYGLDVHVYQTACCWCLLSRLLLLQLHLLPGNLFSPVNALLPTFLLPPNCMGIVMQFLLEYDFLKEEKQKDEEDQEDEREQRQETQHRKAVENTGHEVRVRDLTEKRQIREGKEGGRRGDRARECKEADDSIKKQTVKANERKGDFEEEATVVQEHMSVEQQEQRESKKEGIRREENSSSSYTGRKEQQQEKQLHRSGSNSNHKSEDKTTAAATARLKSFEEVLQHHFPCCVDPVGDLCLAVQFWTEVCAAVDRIDEFIDAAVLVKKIDAATDLLILQCTRAGLHAHPRFPIHAFEVLLR